MSSPASPECEASVLGCMLLDTRQARVALSTLRVEDFYLARHRAVFSACRAVATRGMDVDILTVAEELRRRKILDEVGGGVFLASLIEATPSTEIRDYLRTVIELSAMRNLLRVHADVSLAWQNGGSPREMIERCRHAAFDGQLRILRAERSRFETSEGVASRMLDEVIAWQAPGFDWRKEFVLTGVAGLDERTLGLKPGDLIVVKGATSSGKTALAVQTMDVEASAGGAVVYVSVEMPAHQIAHRLSALRTGVPYIERLKSRLPEADIARIMADPIHALPITYWHEPGAEIGVIVAFLEDPDIRPRLLIADFLQNMRHGGADTREREISYIAGAWKATAERLNCPCILLSQVNDKGEAMWSREAENIADLIIQIRRDKKDKERGVFVVEKHRNGPTGAIPYRWDGRTGAFLDV